MEQEGTAIVRQEADLQNLELTATTPEILPSLQANIADWCRRKISVLEKEQKEYRQSYNHAVKLKWRSEPLLRILARTKKRIQYYQKVIAAVDAGYCLFPPIANADIFAVRTKRTIPKGDWSDDRWHRFHVQPDVLAIGAGDYVSATPRVSQTELPKKDDPAKMTPWWHAVEFGEIEFPVIASRPELIEAAGKAMTLGIFDEIGIVSGRKRDPFLIGNIVQPHRYGARLSFFIAWFLRTADL